MSSFLSELGGITAGVGAEGLAFAAGFAAAHALEPEALTIAQAAWHAAQVRRLPPEIAAEAAAENYATYDVMQEEATYSGWDASRFAYLYDVTVTAPGLGTLLNLLRREDEAPIDFEHGLRKAKLEPQWDAALRNQRYVRIPGPDLAYMVVRGVVPDGGTLPSALPTQADRLELPPQLKLDTIAEAAKTGWDAERFAGLVARSGLAMAPVMAAMANFRGILSDNDYLLTIARGDLFPAYADPVREVAREVPTAKDGVQWQLRGFTDRAGRLGITDLHGMKHDYSDLLYDVAGRAPSPRQVYIGLARGAKYPSTYDDVPEPFRSAIQRSDIRPEFAHIVYMNRFSEPTAFVTRALLSDGAISAERGTTILENTGWTPDLAQLVAEHYAAKSGGSPDPLVSKADTQLWTALHRSYIAGDTDDQAATPILHELGATADGVPVILARWAAERALKSKKLTAAQVKKAVNDSATNAATGAAWTQADALAYLIEELHYNATDAASFLAI